MSGLRDARKGRGRPPRGARLRPRKEAARAVVLVMVHGDHDESTGYGPERLDLAKRRLEAWCVEHGYEKDRLADRTIDAWCAENGYAAAEERGLSQQSGEVPDTEVVRALPAPAPEAPLPDLDSSISAAITWYLAGLRPVLAVATARSWRTYYSYACALKPVLEHCGDRHIRDVNQALLDDLASWHSRQVLRCTQRRLARELAGVEFSPRRRKPKPVRRVKPSTVICSLRRLRSVIIAVFQARQYAWLPTMTIPNASEEPAGAPITDAQVVRLLRACHGLLWDRVLNRWQREPDTETDLISGTQTVRMRRVVDPATGEVREVPRWRFKRRMAWIIERRRSTIRLIVVLLATASRSNVTRDLTWDERPENAYIDAKLEILHRRGTSERDGRTKKRPPVRILESLRRHLRRWRAEDEKLGLTHVLHQANGSPMESMVQKFAAVARDSGQEDVTLHHLRHTVVARLIDVGLNVTEIADFLGVTPETIQKHYNKRRVGQDRVVAALDSRTRQPRSSVAKTNIETPSATRDPAPLPAGRATDHDEVTHATKVVVAALLRSGDAAAAAELERLLGKAAVDAAPSEPKKTAQAQRRESPAPRVARAMPRPPAGPCRTVPSRPKGDEAGPATAIDKASAIIVSALRTSGRPLSGGDLNHVVTGEGLNRDRAEQAKVRLKRAGVVVHEPRGNLWTLAVVGHDAA